MKKPFSLYHIARLLLLIAGITFLLLYAFVKVNGERCNGFLAICLFSTALSNIIGARM